VEYHPYTGVEVLLTGSQFVVMNPVLSVARVLPVMQYGEPSTITELVEWPTRDEHCGTAAGVEAACGVGVTVTVTVGAGALEHPTSRSITATPNKATGLRMG